MEVLDTMTCMDCLTAMRNGRWDDGETAIILSTVNAALAEEAERIADERGIGMNLQTLVYADMNYGPNIVTPPGPLAFNPHLARAAWSFLSDQMDRASYCLPVCDGGVSRSGAMRAFAIRMQGEDDLGEWTGTQYRPNVFVYRLLLPAAGIPLSDSQAAARVALTSELFIRKTTGARVHGMHLAAEPYEAMAAGVKDVELRLWDDKRSGLRPRDLVAFAKVGAPDDILLARVRSLHVYGSFAEMFEDRPDFVTRAGFLDAASARRAMTKLYGGARHSVVAICITRERPGEELEDSQDGVGSQDDSDWLDEGLRRALKRVRDVRRGYPRTTN